MPFITMTRPWAGTSSGMPCPNGVLIKRWDNAPHYPAIDTFPHHLHDGSEAHVVRHPATTGLEVRQAILEEAETQD